MLCSFFAVVVVVDVADVYVPVVVVFVIFISVSVYIAVGCCHFINSFVNLFFAVITANKISSVYVNAFNVTKYVIFLFM